MIIYTCITDNYDVLQPITNLPKGWRAVCFSDSEQTADGWEHVRLPFEPLLHRKVKAMPAEYLGNHERSLWIDGNLRYYGNWKEFDKWGFWVMQHPNRTKLSEEIEACIDLGKDGQHIRPLLAHYGEQKLYATGVMIRTNSAHNQRFGKLWWDEIYTHSHRDQLSFGYIAAKTGTKVEKLPFLKQFVKSKHTSKCAGM